MAYNTNKRFEWDRAKNAANVAKHGLSFEEVTDLFINDTDYLELCDEEHSATEDRFIAVGMAHGQLVVVVHTEPEEELVRVVSARRATRREALLYWYHLRGSDD